MLPLILSLSLVASPGNFSLFGDKCREEENIQKYHLTTDVGLVLLAGGIVLLMSHEDKLGGGFAVAMGAPLVTIGFLGSFEVWKW